MRAAFAIALLSLAGCGGLSNAPLRTGVVEGTVDGADSNLALVAIIGRPELRSSVSADGHFRIADVPTGDQELLVIASSTTAARKTVTVTGATTAAVHVTPEPGAFVHFELQTPGMQSSEHALVSIIGTPFAALSFEAGGDRRVGPLAAGCYDADVRDPTLGTAAPHFCVDKGDEHVEAIPLGSETTTCADTGCPSGLLCNSDGRCVQCIDSCAGSNLACVNNACVAAGAPLSGCEPCTSDAQCGGGSCESTGDGVKLCRQSCTVSCTDQGFICTGAGCVPNPAEFNGCAGYREVGTACTDDADCITEGIYNGECEGGICTLPCEADRDCPNGSACVTIGTEKHCAASE